MATPFSASTVKVAWARAGGNADGSGWAKCECTRVTHGHGTLCGKQLSWNSRGRSGRGAWEAHHRNSNGGDVPSNCEILCWNCHAETF